MGFLITKYAITCAVIVAVSELAKRMDRVGALVSSLPLVTIMVMIWLYMEGQGAQKISNHAYYTFWYVLPTLPMFLLLPYLLDRGMNFWLTLLISAIVTVIAFVLTALIVKRFGVELLF